MTARLSASGIELPISDKRKGGRLKSDTKIERCRNQVRGFESRLVLQGRLSLLYVYVFHNIKMLTWVLEAKPS